MNLSQLVEIAQNVYNRGSSGEKQEKRLARAVTAALKETDPKVGGAPRETHNQEPDLG